MNVQEVKEAVKLAIEAKIVLFIWGPPGVGKSDLIDELAKELYTKNGEDINDVRKLLTANLLQLHDLVGIPYPGKTKEDAILLRPQYNLPEKGKGILFLDELSDGQLSISKALYSLILARRIGPHQIGDEWAIVAAGNRPEDGSGSKLPPPPLVTRMAHVGLYCEPPDFERHLPECASTDIDDWCSWAAEKEINPLIIAFIRFKPEYLYKGQSTPRTWEMVHKILVPADDWGSKVVSTLIKGTVGQMQGTEFYSFMQMSTQIPDIDKVLKSPTTAPIPEQAGVQHALVSSLVYHAKRNNLPAIITYIERLPKEFQSYGVSSLARKDNTFLTVPEMIKWMDKNKDLTL